MNKKEQVVADYLLENLAKADATDAALFAKAYATLARVGFDREVYSRQMPPRNEPESTSK